jgi:predicted DNA-binding transcriptional regulator AlpA
MRNPHNENAVGDWRMQAAIEPINNDILTLDELCAWLKIKRGTGYSLTRNRATLRGGVIPHLKLGKALYFRRSSVQLWLEQREKASAQEAL